MKGISMSPQQALSVRVRVDPRASLLVRAAFARAQLRAHLVALDRFALTYGVIVPAALAHALSRFRR